MTRTYAVIFHSSANACRGTTDTHSQ